MSFKLLRRPLRWEGIVIPGVDFSDPRFETYVAQPRALLSNYIEVAWLFKWDIPHGQEIPIIRVPNPCFKVFMYQGEERFRCSGPRTVGAIYKQSNKGMLLGLDFVPGGFFPLSRISANSMANSVVGIENLLPNFHHPSEKHWSTEVANDWFAKVQDHLQTIPSVRNNLPSIGRFFDRLWQETETPSMDELAESFMTSKRTVQRIFHREIGISPRNAIRITRLQKALKMIGRPENGTLAGSATGSGFFDQPHMTREFKALISSSPARFKKFI